MKLRVFAKHPNQILLRIILSERAFFCKQLSPGILLQFSQNLFVFPNLCINMHILKPRTRFTTSFEVVYLNPDLHWACPMSSTNFFNAIIHEYILRPYSSIGRGAQWPSDSLRLRSKRSGVRYLPPPCCVLE